MAVDGEKIYLAGHCGQVSTRWGTIAWPWHRDAACRKENKR